MLSRLTVPGVRTSACEFGGGNNTIQSKHSDFPAFGKFVSNGLLGSFTYIRPSPPKRDNNVNLRTLKKKRFMSFWVAPTEPRLSEAHRALRPLRSSRGLSEAKTPPASLVAQLLEGSKRLWRRSRAGRGTEGLCSQGRLMSHAEGTMAKGEPEAAPLRH